LDLVGVVGKCVPRHVYVRQTGEIRTSPNKGWVAMEAEESFSLDPPGFVWKGSIRPGPLVRVAAVDQFADGHGSMRISAWGKIPIGTVSGPEADSGELMRFLVESVWFPAFWVAPMVRWEAIDETSVRVSVQVGGVEASSQMHFGGDGLLCSIESQRHRVVGKRFVLTPWKGRCWDYRELDAGVRVPHRISVTWGLPEGDFEWFRAVAERIAYT
jgi:hypothetical protein